jgi:carbonic anhydrase/acetyltransferase-like protein (isoleucine patch superfamily)
LDLLFVVCLLFALSIVLPQTQVTKLRGITPQLNGVFVASSATIVGNVKIGANSSVMYGAVMRGDDNSITIGEQSTIGDRVMVHASKHPKPAPTVVGNRAVIGSGAILHGCTIEDGAVVGEGAQVLDQAKIGAQAVLAAGSILLGNKEIPPRQLWAGVPAKFQRELSSEELEAMYAVVEENVDLARMHAEETAKSWHAIEVEQFDSEQMSSRSAEYYRRLSPEELSKRLGEVEGHDHPGRILDSNGTDNSHFSIVCFI